MTWVTICGPFDAATRIPFILKSYQVSVRYLPVREVFDFIKKTVTLFDSHSWFNNIKINVLHMYMLSYYEKYH